MVFSYIDVLTLKVFILDFIDVYYKICCSKDFVSMIVYAVVKIKKRNRSSEWQNDCKVTDSGNSKARKLSSGV